jgi:hypothetical protein
VENKKTFNTATEADSERTKLISSLDEVSNNVDSLIQEKQMMAREIVIFIPNFVNCLE